MCVCVCVCERVVSALPTPVALLLCNHGENWPFYSQAYQPSCAQPLPAGSVPISACATDTEPMCKHPEAIYSVQCIALCEQKCTIGFKWLSCLAFQIEFFRQCRVWAVSCIPTEINTTISSPNLWQYYNYKFKTLQYSALTLCKSIVN